MTDSEKRYNVTRIRLKTPEDARRLIRRVLAEIFGQGAEVENAGKVANLLTVWAKFWELEQVADLERRITELEKVRKEKR
ncbi:MAG: hypothetical protein A4E48_00787 [Methanosaeta sp. PtaU1.Bin060]|nr:MAG: hypothetical protein A4E48_00787 [Methanosaeta sp. PtaU1.Bin060]